MGNSGGLFAQCSFVSPTVDIISVTPTSTGDMCTITFNLGFDINVNSGNKIIFVHLWEEANYPNPMLNYGCNQCQPHAADLQNTVANFSIDDFSTTPQLKPTYGPDPTVANVFYSAPITVQRTTSAVPGATRFYINNISLVIDNACQDYVFKGDAWASNSNNTNSSVQCAMQGIIIGGADPAVTGQIYCANKPPYRRYEFSISTTSTDAQVYYDVYLDNGDKIFQPSQDILIKAVGMNEAISITPGSPYNSGVLTFPVAYQQAAYDNRVLFIQVAKAGASYLALETLDPANCAVLAIKLTDFKGTRLNNNEVEISWTAIETSKNDKYQLEKSINGKDWVTLKEFPATYDNGSKAVYSFIDNNISTTPTLYRIAMHEASGKFYYSPTINIPGNNKAIAYIISPNPSFNNSINIRLSSKEEKVNILITDISGRVLRKLIRLNSGTYMVSNLPSGIYLVKLFSDNESFNVTEKVVIH